MSIDDLTAEQDAAFVELRKLHNRDYPNDPVTKGQLVQRHATRAFNLAVVEADERLTAIELRAAYRAASGATQAQVKTLLGL